MNISKFELILFITLPLLTLSQSNFNCFNSTFCGDHGMCINETHCQCDKGYTTFGDSLESQCNYRMLSKKVAFFLSFFLGPVGVDRIYVGNIGIGYLKLVLSLFLTIFGLFLFLFGKKKEREHISVLGKVIESISTITIVIWWVVDWSLILHGSMKDLNGIKLNQDL